MEYLGRNKDGITEIKVEDHDSVPWESEEKKVKFDQQLAEESSRAQEASQTGGVWSWFRNSMLGRTFGLDDESRAGGESKGLWNWTRNSMLGRTFGLDDESRAGGESKGLWSWMRNSMLGRTFGLDDESRAGGESKGLWNWMRNSMLGRTFGLDDTSRAGGESKGLWSWMRNSMLGRTFGLDDTSRAGGESKGLWSWMRNSMLGRTFGLDDVSRAGGESKGLWNWFSNSMVGRWVGLDDESKTGKESQGLWGWMRNSMLGRTFGLDDVSRAGGESKGLWNWFSNSMVGRWFGLDDAGKATVQPAQKDDVIVEKGATEKAHSNESSVKELSRTKEATKSKAKSGRVAQSPASKEQSQTAKAEPKEVKSAENIGGSLLDSYFSEDKPSIDSRGTHILPSSLTGALGQSLTSSDLTSIQGKISSMREPLNHSQHSQTNTEITVDSGLSLDSILGQGMPSLSTQSDQLTPDANDSVSTPQIPGQGISNNTERADPAQPLMPRQYNGRE